ncbi:MAG: sugar transferase [Phycisphaerales bacterium]|jgi:lipopolysaccharide/colanic/teichoic acid biosynthesis glycosyltransferase
MNLIVFRKISPPITQTSRNSDSLIRFALDSEIISNVFFHGLNRCFQRDEYGKIFYAVPEEWSIESHIVGLKTIAYKADLPICPEFLQKSERNEWFVISNGRFATQIDRQLLKKVLTEVQVGIVAVNVKPELSSGREKIRFTAQGRLAGFSRLYSDPVELAPVFTNWPHHLFIRTHILDQILANGTLPQSFSTIVEKCCSNELALRAINLGGVVLDLETQGGMLDFCKAAISGLPESRLKVRNSNTISQDSRFVGKVLLGKKVDIGPKTIVVGPAIIGDNVKIEEGAVINLSIIGPGVSVPRNQLVRNCIIKELQYDWKQPIHSIKNGLTQVSCKSFSLGRKQYTNGTFRSWPRFSYAGCFKRIVDCFAAIIVLILFAPIMPFIALSVKLTSPGPVFFKDKRQGLYGKTFNCLKFRTMRFGADSIQDKLRSVSQVDGPQFKIADDPRISAVGRFLRDTYLDEIPQFINVLLGQMSVIGPRPSPESENTMCPFWRDARLSVRPGVTGLWQICRTRQPMKDFQEWIHYDVEYVRKLSLGMDLWICWQTTKKLIDNFINQF